MTLHDRMESLADLLIAGGLSAEEKNEAERHAAGCSPCGALLRDAREFAVWAKGRIRSDAPPADLEDRVIERFRAAGQTKRRRFIVGKRVLKVTGSIAAAVGLIFFGNVFISHRPGGDPAASFGGLAAAQADWAERAQKPVHTYFSDESGVDVVTDGIAMGTNGTPSSATFDHYFGEVKERSRSLGENSAEGLERGARGLDRGTRADLSALETATVMLYSKSPAAPEKGRLAERGGEELLARLGRSASESQERGDLGQGHRLDGKDGRAGDTLGRPLGAALGIEKGLGDDKDAPLQKENKSSLNAKSEGAPAAAESLAEHPKLQNSQPPRPDPLKQRLKSGDPQDMTAAVVLDDLEAKAVPAGEEAKVARPSALKPGLQDLRKIIRTAEVSLEVDSYEATYTKLSDLVAAEKGLVSSASTQKAANGKMQATVVLRVPPERFEPLLGRLKELGTVRSQNVDSEDVTKAYVDLETRLKSKAILAERLSKLLAEGKGTVKELMEVEVQLGATNEAIESLKGEIKYYDNRIALSTLTLQIAEKDFGQPFEVVQTLQANLALTVRDPDEAYAQAQKEIAGAGGQVVDSRMNRQSDGSSTGTIRGRVDAEKFPALRETLKKLGVATNDTVNQQKTAHGGREGMPKADAPLRKEQAVLDLSVSSPPIFVTRRLQLVVETGEVERAYQNSRKSIEGSGGKIVDGSLMGRGDRLVAVLKVQADAGSFSALRESLKTAGKVKNETVSSVLPAASADGGPALLRERAEIDFTLVSPPQLIADENGIGKSIRDTFANSWAGLLWSVEKLFVGISLAGPWLLLLGAGVLAWRRFRRRRAPSAP